MIAQGQGIISLIWQIRRVLSNIDLSKTDYPNALSLSRALISGERRVSRNQRKLGMTIPRFMYFSVTHQCNLSCRGCYAKNWERGSGLSVDQITSIIDQSIELGTYVFVIAGGEPLMVYGLLDAIRERKGSIFIMFTNGTLVSEGLADSIVETGNMMPVVSLDGPKEMNDARRGLGVWDKATHTMRLLQERGSLYGFSSMLTHKNCRLLLSRKYLDTMWKLGCRLGFFIDYIPFPNNLNPVYMLTTEDFQIKTELVKKARLENRPYIVNFPPDEYLVNGGKCMALRSSVHVNADGWLEPCPYSHYASHNLTETPLVDALQSEFFKSLREEFSGKVNPSNTCHLFAAQEKVKEIGKRTGAESTDHTV